MIISSALDYRMAAKKKLPRFLFDYIDGGAYAELTLRANESDLEQILLKQRVLQQVNHLTMETSLFGEHMSMPLGIDPVGISGMYARRGEVQAAKAAQNQEIPFILSTLSICSIEEVCAHCTRPIWFQLYLLKDRGFMTHVLERAQAAGIKNLVFTVDMPLPGARYRDKHSGMSGPYAPLRRWIQAFLKPRWAYDVGLMGRPHDLANVSTYLGESVGLEDYIGWLNDNLFPSIGWSDLEWIRDFWQGPIIIKGILDPEDAKDAVQFGANGIIVSNHGGRQLDGTLSTAKALPGIVDAVGEQTVVMVDSGVRSGLDAVKMLALGAKSVFIGRSMAFALAAEGQAGVENLITLFANEIRIAMTLLGVNSIDQINQSNLV